MDFLNTSNSDDEISSNLSEQSLTSVLTMDDYIQNLSNTHHVKVESTKFFDLYLTPSDMSSIQNNVILPSDGIRIVLNESNSEDFFNELKNDSRVSEALTMEELEENFDLGYHLKHIDTIFTRVFG